MKVRMLDKFIKFDVKFFIFCDVKSRYCKNVIIYVDKDDVVVGVMKLVY